MSLELNPVQKLAAEHGDGPLLVIAGPGSGKTRVITHRVAFLVNELGVHPDRIAAVTFTNRAAREMRDRMTNLLSVGEKFLTASTFHSLCARILRVDGAEIGVFPDYVIMDDSDQIDLVKRAMMDSQVDPKRFPPRNILAAISRSKAKLVNADSLKLESGSYYEEIVAQIFSRYQTLISSSHGLDFDDLLVKTIDLFTYVPEVLAKYQSRFRYLLVDEFQDTNLAQYQLSKMIASNSRNLCVVGDPNQSIYAWRNADIGNILSFQQDFPDSKVVSLDQNYRSTKNILEAAQNLILVNKQRLEGELFTDNPKGKPVVIAEAYTEEEEAQAVLNEISRINKEEQFNLRDCVVTYRINAQSRAMEEACLRNGIPYKLIGGVRFYQRKEVKDILAYLRLLLDPFDEVSLIRIINMPARGIGKKTIEDLRFLAKSHDLTVFQVIQLLVTEEHVSEKITFEKTFPKKLLSQLDQFITIIEDLRKSLATNNLSSVISLIIENTGYRRMLLDLGDLESDERLENLKELQGVASELSDMYASETLPDFLANMALVSDQDAIEDEQQYLTLITLHQIKGLEFPAVFMVGMEEGLLPHSRSFDDDDQIEEERRVAYVGMTRAKKRLYLFRAFRRKMFGVSQGNGPSRFLNDIPLHIVERPGKQPISTANISYDKWKNSSSIRNIPIGSPFKAGEKVKHDSFGQGVVISCKQKGIDFEVTVVFSKNTGIKTFLHSFANLKLVENPSG